MKSGQKRPVTSPAPQLATNPHLHQSVQMANHIVSGNHLPTGAVGSIQQGTAGGGGGGTGGAGGTSSGPFASALRSLAIKADIKDEDGGDASGGRDGGDLSREGGAVMNSSSNAGTNNSTGYSTSNIVGNDNNGNRNGPAGANNRPSDLSKGSGSMRSSGHDSRQHSASDRSRAEHMIADERQLKKRTASSPPPEKVNLKNKFYIPRY